MENRKRRKPKPEDILSRLDPASIESSSKPSLPISSKNSIFDTEIPDPAYTYRKPMSKKYASFILKIIESRGKEGRLKI